MQIYCINLTHLSINFITILKDTTLHENQQELETSEEEKVGGKASSIEEDIFVNCITEEPNNSS